MRPPSTRTCFYLKLCGCPQVHYILMNGRRSAVEVLWFCILFKDQVYMIARIAYNAPHVELVCGALLHIIKTHEPQALSASAFLEPKTSYSSSLYSQLLQHIISFAQIPWLALLTCVLSTIFVMQLNFIRIKLNFGSAGFSRSHVVRTTTFSALYSQRRMFHKIHTTHSLPVVRVVSP